MEPISAFNPMAGMTATVGIVAAVAKANVARVVVVVGPRLAARKTTTASPACIVKSAPNWATDALKIANWDRQLTSLFGGENNCEVVLGPEAEGEMEDGLQFSLFHQGFGSLFQSFQEGFQNTFRIVDSGGPGGPGVDFGDLEQCLSLADLLDVVDSLDS